MKLRIKGNSVRLRLLRSEVDRLVTDGRIEDVTSFGANALRYSLATSEETDKIYAAFEDNEIRVVLPHRSAREWAVNDQVGFAADQPNGSSVLTILIEKDFACLDRPDDPDRKDAYPNPGSECGTPEDSGQQAI